MSHLPVERLAALVDEPPTSSELAHLASCQACAREREAFATMRAMAASEHSRIGLPLTRWESLAPALRADGVIEVGLGRGRPRVAPSGRHTRRRGWLQAAAALLLLTGGAAVGRWSAGGAIPLVGRVVAAAPSAEGGMRDVAFTPPDSLATFSSIEEARHARARYEVLYQRAALYLASHDSSGFAPDTPAAMRTRLATLDRVGATVRAALDEAPYDPVINGYYLTTLGQREATLQELNTALPTGARINSF